MSDKEQNETSNAPEFKVVDPLALYKQMYFMAEDSWSKVASAVVASDAFSEFIGKFLENYLNVEKVSNKYIDRYMETLHVPTRDDLARLATQVINVETKIDNLDERLDEIVDQLSGVPGTAVATATGTGDVKASVDELKTQLDSLTDKMDEILSATKGNKKPVKKVTAE